MAKTVSNSSYLVSANDSIKRTVGLDIRRAMGGKTAAELAEERLKKELDQTRGFSGYTSGYQGISIPITESAPQSSSKDMKVNTGSSN